MPELPDKNQTIRWAMTNLMMYNFTLPGHILTLPGQFKVKMLLCSYRDFAGSTVLWWNLNFGGLKKIGTEITILMQSAG